MFDFWYELPPSQRALMGLALIGISIFIWFISDGSFYAIGCFVVGLVFLLGAGVGKHDDYNF